jgi:hypothetical protein
MQRLIMIAGYLSHLLESTLLDIIHPGGEVFDDVTWHRLQLLPRLLAQFHPINHICTEHTPGR